MLNRVGPEHVADEATRGLQNEDYFLHEYYIAPFTRRSINWINDDVSDDDVEKGYDIGVLRESKEKFEKELDENMAKLLWICGNSGCGKSTYVHKLGQIHRQKIKIRREITMAYASLILIAIKLLVDLALYVINTLNQRESERHSSDGISCKHLKVSDGRSICTNVLFMGKMSAGVCPRENCGGYDTGRINVNDNNVPFISSPWVAFVKKTIDLFPEISAALLALNEIITK